MQKLSNEEIARVFAMYPGARVINPRFPDSGVSYDLTMAGWFGGSYFNKHREDCWDNRVLQLHDLEQISDASVTDLAKILKFSENELESAKREVVHVILSSYSLADFCGPYPNIYSQNIHHCYEYLKTKFHSVPLFFGAGHWANGKNAVQLNIAVNI